MSDVKLIIPPEVWNLSIGFELNKETNLFDKSTITIELPNNGVVDLQYQVMQDIISMLNQKYWSKTMNDAGKKEKIIIIDDMVERAMNTKMPGGSAAGVWLFNCEGGYHPEEKHKEWFRKILESALS